MATSINIDKLRILRNLQDSYARGNKLAQELYETTCTLLGETKAYVADEYIPLLDASLRAKSQSAKPRPIFVKSSLPSSIPVPAQYSAFAVNRDAAHLSYVNGVLHTPEDYDEFYTWLGQHNGGSLAMLETDPTKPNNDYRWTIRAPSIDTDSSKTEIFDTEHALPTCAAVLRSRASAFKTIECAWCYFELVLGGAVDLPESLTHWTPTSSEPPFLKDWTRLLSSSPPSSKKVVHQKNAAVEILREIYWHHMHSGMLMNYSNIASNVEKADDLANTILSLYRGTKDSTEQFYMYPPGLRKWSLPDHSKSNVEKLQTHFEKAIKIGKESLQLKQGDFLPYIRKIALSRAQRNMAWSDPSDTLDDLMKTWVWSDELQIRTRFFLKAFGLPSLTTLLQKEDRVQGPVWQELEPEWEKLKKTNGEEVMLAVTWYLIHQTVKDGYPDRWKVHTPSKSNEEAVHLNHYFKAMLTAFYAIPSNTSITQNYRPVNSYKVWDTPQMISFKINDFERENGNASLPMLSAIYALKRALLPPEGLNNIENIRSAQYYAIDLLNKNLKHDTQKIYLLKDQNDLSTLYEKANNLWHTLTNQKAEEEKPSDQSFTSRLENLYVAQIVRSLAIAFPRTLGPTSQAAALALIITDVNVRDSLRNESITPKQVLASLAASALSRFSDIYSYRVESAFEESVCCELDFLQGPPASEGQLLMTTKSEEKSQLYATALQSFTTWTRLYRETHQEKKLKVLHATLKILRSFLSKVKEYELPENLKYSIDSADDRIKGSVQEDLNIIFQPSDDAQTPLALVVDASRIILPSYDRSTQKIRNDFEELKKLKNFLHNGDHILLLYLGSDRSNKSQQEYQLGELQNLGHILDATLQLWRPQSKSPYVIYTKTRNVKLTDTDKVPYASILASLKDIQPVKHLHVAFSKKNFDTYANLVQEVLSELPKLQRSPTIQEHEDVYTLTYTLLKTHDHDYSNDIINIWKRNPSVKVIENSTDDDKKNRAVSIARSGAAVYMIDPTSESNLTPLFDKHYVGTALGTIWFLDAFKDMEMAKTIEFFSTASQHLSGINESKFYIGGLPKNNQRSSWKNTLAALVLRALPSLNLDTIQNTINNFSFDISDYSDELHQLKELQQKLTNQFEGLNPELIIYYFENDDMSVLQRIVSNIHGQRPDYKSRPLLQDVPSHKLYIAVVNKEAHPLWPRLSL